MKKTILVEYGDENREIAVTEGKRLLCFLTDAPFGVRAEEIYLGAVDRIARVIPS